jgi:DNA-binding XRE family transcriptional regulator
MLISDEQCGAKQYNVIHGTGYEISQWTYYQIENGRFEEVINGSSLPIKYLRKSVSPLFDVACILRAAKVSLRHVQLASSVTYFVFNVKTWMYLMS